MVSIGLLIFAVYMAIKIYQPMGKGERPELIEVTIEEGQGSKSLAEELLVAGVIDNKFVFRTALFLSGKQNKVKKGVFEMSNAQSPMKIVEIITGNDEVREGKITIVEGLSDREIAEELGEFFSKKSTTSKDKEQIKKEYQEKFLAEASDIKKYQADYVFLASLPEDSTLEGFLFPDTYRFFMDATPEEVIRKLLDNFEFKVYETLKQDLVKNDLDWFETIVLASIVEKEVHGARSMAAVAGVYWNRLEMGKKFESDATINYITGNGNPQPTFEDLRVDSPYNTYKYEGLPPGPICNPGFDAVRATISPEEHDFIFFITKPDTGEPVFAKTGTEHLENKEKYLDNN